MGRGRGAPGKLTPEVQAKIVQAIGAGNYYEPAAKYGGISYETFNEWMKLGAKAKRKNKYSDFSEAVKQAEAQAEVIMVAQWRAHMPLSWQAVRDFLARRHPEQWANKDKHEHSIDLKTKGYVNVSPDDWDDDETDGSI